MKLGVSTTEIMQTEMGKDFVNARAKAESLKQHYKTNEIGENEVIAWSSYKLKNGNVRTTIAERGFILEKLKADITKELKALKQYSELDIEMMVDEAIENNSFDNLPSSIKEKYTISPYICYYDFSAERKIHLLQSKKGLTEQLR